ncbi:hypothetical protein NMY22_g13426 [Coprinellus aureogranulatus]|nr:hypothetical protein NMY22_g13426 [Coprinellus aureogranulatus]
MYPVGSRRHVRERTAFEARATKRHDSHALPEATVTSRLLARGFVLKPVCDERDISILEELSNAGICSQLEDLVLKYFSNGGGDGRTEMALVDLCISRVGQLDGEEAASSPQLTIGRRIGRVKASFSPLSKVDILGELRRCGIDLGGVNMSISYPPPHLIDEGSLVWPSRQ